MAVVAWILTHRQQIGFLCLGIGLGLLLARIGSNPPQIKAEATATQGQQGKAETKVVYRYIKGQECPEIEVSSVLSGSQGQTATAKAQVAPPSPALAFPLGIGYLGQPFVSAGLHYDRLQLEALKDPTKPLNDAWGGKATWNF